MFRGRGRAHGARPPNGHAAALAEALRLYNLAAAALADAGAACPAFAASAIARTCAARAASRTAMLRALLLAPPPRPMREFDEAAMRRRRVVPFDTARHPLRARMAALIRLGGWLNVDADADADADGTDGAADKCVTLLPDDALATLHARPRAPHAPACPAVLAAFKLAGAALPPAWSKRTIPGRRGRQGHIKAFRAAPEYAAFLAAYRRFVADVIVPLVGDPRGVVFQCPPTLRVVVPSARAVGKPHRDLDYARHEEGEINFWVPMTEVWGANSLHLESSPGAGDFTAVALGYGRALRFDGAHCHHHTVPNTTDATRVSFDFRVIPVSFWRDSHGRRVGDYDLELAVPAEEEGGGGAREDDL